jgi:hypothetical protein
MNTITNESVRKTETVKDSKTPEKDKNGNVVARVNRDGTAEVAKPDTQRDIAKVDQ